MKSFICIKCSKLFLRADYLRKHQKRNCKKTATTNLKEMSEQPTFKIQFNPKFDEMILAAHNQQPCGLHAQKYLLEEYYFKEFENHCLNLLENKNDKPVRIIAHFNYINRSNECKLKTIEFTTKLNNKNLKKEYLNKITQPIIAEISEIEAGKDAIVLNMCFVKFFFKNLEPLKSQSNVEIVQINNAVYAMDEDCNLKFLKENEDEIPGFRNM